MVKNSQNEKRKHKQCGSEVSQTNKKIEFGF